MAHRARKRASKLKPPTQRRRWRPLFLATVASTGNVTESCRIAGVERSSVYELREKDKAFAKAWDDAVERAMDALEHALRNRALEGVSKYVHHKGVVVMVPVDAAGNVINAEPEKAAQHADFARWVPLVEREYSDAGAMFLLRGYRERFRESHKHVHAHTGPRSLSDADADARALHDEIRQAFGLDGPPAAPPAPAAG